MSGPELPPKREIVALIDSLRGAIAALEAALKGARGEPSATDEPPANKPDSPSSAA